MSINRWVNGVLVILVVIWGGLSVDEVREQAGEVSPVTQNTPKQSYITSQSEAVSPPPQTSNVIEHENSPKPTSSAEAAVRNLFAKLESAATLTPTLASSSAPVASSTPVPTSTPTPVAQISYKIQGGGVFYDGALDAAGLSVGEATKRIAAHHGISFVYNATPLGWFVTELAGLKQQPAQEKYWLYWVNGAFGEVSSDKKVLQPGDTLIWQYGS